MSKVKCLCNVRESVMLAPGVFSLWIDAPEIAESAAPASTEILGSVSDGLLSALGMLLNVVIGIIVSIYLMAGKERFCAQAKRLLYTIFSE